MYRKSDFIDELISNIKKTTGNTIPREDAWLLTKMVFGTIVSMASKKKLLLYGLCVVEAITHQSSSFNSEGSKVLKLKFSRIIRNFVKEEDQEDNLFDLVLTGPKQPTEEDEIYLELY